jgi:UDPglucose 6-dehydrogenase
MSVIGCGYLGAVHAVAMAHLGHQVIGIDVFADKVAQLQDGQAPFHEPGLTELLQTSLSSGRLSFSTDIAAAGTATVHFLCVGTPQLPGQYGADLGQVDAAVQGLLPYLKPGDLVVGKSTVPVGTCERIADQIAAIHPQVTVVWNPEFLREGFAVQDTLHPDRIVYGVPAGEPGQRAKAVLDQVYAAALAEGVPALVTDTATAQLVKAAANSFLATKISFINAMAELCEATGADVTELADAIGFDERIGRRFLNAGLGFGGGCLPKDIRAFQARADELGVGRAVAFLEEVDQVNLRRRERVVQLVTDACGGQVSGARVAVLGAAFKPDSDDVRDSPALDVANRLRTLGARVVVTDPQAVPNAQRRSPDLEFAKNAAEAAAGADVVILATEWSEYQDLDPTQLGRIVLGRTMIDARNVLDPAVWRAAGWVYRGLGRH